MEFNTRMTENEKRDNSGYKIILKRYKKKYFGSKAKVLKKFRDISRISINSKSAKTSLNQSTTKIITKTKSKKAQCPNSNAKPLEGDNQNQEETQTGCDEYTVEDDEEEEAEIVNDDE